MVFLIAGTKRDAARILFDDTTVKRISLFFIDYSNIFENT